MIVVDSALVLGAAKRDAERIDCFFEMITLSP